MSWAPRSVAQANAAQGNAVSAVSDARGLAAVSVMALGSGPGRGTATSIALPQALDAPEWPPFSGMSQRPAPRSPDLYSLRPVYFDAQAFESAADCLTVASLRRLPLEVCE